jgi:hemerythrin
MTDASWGAMIARGCKAAISAERVCQSKQIEQLARAPDDSFARGYSELVARLEQQMRNEEAIMESVNCRALRSHQEQHARVLAALHQAEPRIEEGDLALGREALALLAQWLLAHHAELDLALLTSMTPMGRHGLLEAHAFGAAQRRRFPRPPRNNSSAAP